MRRLELAVGICVGNPSPEHTRQLTKQAGRGPRHRTCSEPLALGRLLVTIACDRAPPTARGTTRILDRLVQEVNREIHAQRRGVFLLGEGREGC